MSQGAAVRHLNVDSSDPVLLNRNAAFGFDAEVAADTAGIDAGPAISPPIAVPTNKANHSRQHLSVEVGYEPPEFRTVSPQTTWDQGNTESATDSPIGGGLMYVQSPIALILQCPNSTFSAASLPPMPHSFFCMAQKIQRSRMLMQVGLATRAFPSVSSRAGSMPRAALPCAHACANAAAHAAC